VDTARTLERWCSVDVHSLKPRIVSGVLWLTATKAVGQLMTWVLTIIIVRLLSPQDYGLMGMATLFIGFVLLFNDLGLGAAIIQKPQLADEDASDLRWAIFLINLALFLAAWPAAPLIAGYFREPALVNMIRVLGATFVISGIGSPAGHMLCRELAFKKTSQAEFFGALSGGISTLTLALFGFGVWSLVSGYVIQQIVTNGLYCAYRPLKTRVGFSFRNVAGSVNFGFKVALTRLLWYGSSNADFMIVGRVLGKLQLGYYSMAFQFSSIPIEKVVTIITQVALPSFAVLQKDDETLSRYYLKLIGVIAFITFPMFLGLFAIADQAVELFLTAKWTPVVLPLKILCVVSCLRAVETMNAPLVLAKGRPEIKLYNTALQAIVMPIAFYIGTQSGVTGVAIAWLLVWPLVTAIVTWQTLRLIAIQPASYLAEMKHPALGSIAMVAVVALAQKYVLTGPPTLRSFGITCALGALVYFGYTVLFNRAIVHEALATFRPERGAAAPTPAIVDLPTGRIAAPRVELAIDGTENISLAEAD
jgi:teichuronic acid exporter